MQDPHDRRDESIAGARDRFNKRRRAIPVTDGFAQAGDVNAQDAFFDEGVGPHLRQQLLFRQQPAGLTHERHEQIVRFRREMIAMSPRDSDLPVASSVNSPNAYTSGVGTIRRILANP